jgi:hypothetical protein
LFKCKQTAPAYNATLRRPTVAAQALNNNSIVSSSPDKNLFAMENKITYHIGCSLKFILKVGVEESIVNASRITDRGSAV